MGLSSIYEPIELPSVWVAVACDDYVGHDTLNERLLHPPARRWNDLNRSVLAYNENQAVGTVGVDITRC